EKNAPPACAVRSCIAAQFADLDCVAVLAGILARTRPCDCDRAVVVVGLDHTKAGDDFLGFDVGAVAHDACLDDSAARLQTVAADDRRTVLLHPCVPGLLQRLHFLGGRLGPVLRGFAVDEQKLRHDTLLQTISPAPAEARPPPYATTTNERRHFGHRSRLFCKCVPRLGAD